MEVILRIVRITARYRLHLTAAYLCTAGATAAYLFLPWLFGNAIDEIAQVVVDGDVSDSAILTLVLAILGLSVLRGILSFGQTYLGEALSQLVAYDLRNAFYDHVQHLSFGFHDRHHTGNLMSRAITDVEAVRMFINMGMVRGPYFISSPTFCPLTTVPLRLSQSRT